MHWSVIVCRSTFALIFCMFLHKVLYRCTCTRPFVFVFYQHKDVLIFKSELTVCDYWLNLLANGTEGLLRVSGETLCLSSASSGLNGGILCAGPPRMRRLSGARVWTKSWTTAVGALTSPHTTNFHKTYLQSTSWLCETTIRSFEEI